MCVFVHKPNILIETYFKKKIFGIIIKKKSRNSEISHYEKKSN